MKISIPKKIDLGKIIQFAQWDGAYINVRSCTVKDITEFNKFQSSIANSTKKYERELVLRNKLLEENPQSQEAQKRVEELESLIAENTEKILQFTIDFLKDRFISGVAYDEETKKLGSLTANDVEQFDIQIIQTVVQTMMGAVSKKA